MSRSRRRRGRIAVLTAILTAVPALWLAAPAAQAAPTPQTRGTYAAQAAPTPHTRGTYAARVGSTSPTNGDSSIAQTFTAPSGTSTLGSYYNVTCPDTLTYDWATATLKDNTTGTTTTVPAKTCVSSSGWIQKTASVTAGHSYTLTLISHDDNYTGDATYTRYDDVTLS